MALTRTCLQLETGARQRADKVGSSFRDTAAFKRYLSASCRRLVSKLERISDYWASTVAIATVANTATTAVPADMFKALALRCTLNGVRVRLDEASVDEIDIEVTPTGWLAGETPRFRVRGGLFYWVPIPTAIHSITLDYVPTTIFRTSGAAPISEFTADTDTFDGIFGWEDWVELDAAARALSDEGKHDSAAALRVERDDVLAEIIQAASHRSAEDAPRIRDAWRGGSDYEVEPWRR